MSRTHEMELSCEQTIRSRGVCEPALEPRGEWEGSETRGQEFKPDLGNPAVRHYRGAFENVAMVEMRTQLAIERAGLVTLHLQLARRSSIPTIGIRRAKLWPGSSNPGRGDQRCFTCIKRICPLLVVRTSLSELSRATLVFRFSCSMGSPDRGRVRTGIPMTRSSSSVKAGECGQ